MKNFDLLLEVADAVEKSIAEGYKCDWYSGSTNYLFEDKEGCPAMLYALQKGMVTNKENVLYHTTDPLLYKISNITLKAKKNSFNIGLVTPESIRKVAIRYQKRNEQSKLRRLKKKQTA